MRYIKDLWQKQRGQTMVIVLIIMGLGSLMVIPVLNYMGTGLNSVRAYHRQAGLLYAADAGIKDGMWKIQDGEVPQLVDYSHTYPAFTVNGMNVVVTIDYCWLLSGIVDAVFGPHDTWFGVCTTGNPDLTGKYTIRIEYSTEGANKKVGAMGVWLPIGYSYVPGSCGAANFPNNMTNSAPIIQTTHGGTSIKWEWANPGYSFKSATGGVALQEFYFNPAGQTPKGDVCWVSSLSSDIGLSWDNMIWNYTITSTATDPATGKSAAVVSEVASDSGPTSGIGVITYEIQ